MIKFVESNEGNNVLDDLISIINTKLDDGDIRIRYVQREESEDGEVVTYSIATVKTSKGGE